MNGQPAPKTEELADKINVLFAKRRRPTEFEIRLLKREAKNLSGKMDYADYYDVLGLISGVAHQKNDVMENYKKALDLSPNNFNIQKNYMVCLANSGFIKEEYEQAMALLNNFPNNPETLSIVTDTIFRSCRFSDVSQLLNKFGNFKYDIAMSNIFNSVCLTDDEAQHLCQLAHGILEIHNIYFSQRNIRIVDDCVLYTIYIDLPIEGIFEVNWELSGIFAELDDMRSDVLLFEYSSIDVLEEKEAYERII